MHKHVGKATCALFILFFCSIGYAQESVKTKSNAVSFELGKTGLLYSISFDRQFSTGKAGIRISAGSNFGAYEKAFMAGGGLYSLAGKGKHRLELGAELHYLRVEEVSDDQKGFSLIYPDYPINTFLASLNIGYRKQGEKILFRMGISPGVFKDGFVPGGYIGIGIRF